MTLPSDINQNETHNESLIIDDRNISIKKHIGTDYSYKYKLVWRLILGYTLIYTMTIWGLSLMVAGRINYKTNLWLALLMFTTTEGVMIGAHRLFSHKSFKATPLLKAIILFFLTMSGQGSAYAWARDHRLHHRYVDTDADPHNSERGFFFSHIGWLMCKKHPYVLSFGKNIDMSDLDADWMVMFQRKYYAYIYLISGILIPIGVPYYFFGESLCNSIIVCYFIRFCFQLHFTFLINSAAHMYGTRPYDKNLNPVESWFVSLVTLGEGWHNYHHSFPWDYKAGELPMPFNISATLIRWFEKLGLAYDLKTASSALVEKRILKSGDGTHYALGNDNCKNTVTAFGILHPLNPTYNVVYE